MQIEIGLTAAIVAADETTPLILVVRGSDADEAPDGLPSGPFNPLSHRTFEIALRSFVQEQTGLSVGYVEQLYTFGDRGRVVDLHRDERHAISVGYLALTRQPDARDKTARAKAEFRPWYSFFPWEDGRRGRPKMVEAIIVPLLKEWASGRPERLERVRQCFGIDGVPFDEELVLERYELLYEAGLVEEARFDGRPAALARESLPQLGLSMRADNRRILATAISRLRGKLKYRPVIFELMPTGFTLTALQRTVEAISGALLHKQNFRRLVEQGALVESTGEALATGGRPAALFRFRREVMRERPTPGLRVGSRG